jgi:manganese transport protein
VRLGWLFTNDQPRPAALEVLRYVGPGFLVTVGLVDPGNWAANIAAGSSYGYELLWMVTLSTVMFVVLQHNATHLGAVVTLCLVKSLFGLSSRAPRSPIPLVGYGARSACGLACGET